MGAVTFAMPTLSRRGTLCCVLVAFVACAHTVEEAVGNVQQLAASDPMPAGLPAQLDANFLGESTGRRGGSGGGSLFGTLSFSRGANRAGNDEEYEDLGNTAIMNATDNNRTTEDVKTGSDPVTSSEKDRFLNKLAAEVGAPKGKDGPNVKANGPKVKDGPKVKEDAVSRLYMLEHTDPTRAELTENNLASIFANIEANVISLKKKAIRNANNTLTRSIKDCKARYSCKPESKKAFRARLRKYYFPGLPVYTRWEKKKKKTNFLNNTGMHILCGTK